MSCHRGLRELGRWWRLPLDLRAQVASTESFVQSSGPRGKLWREPLPVGKQKEPGRLDSSWSPDRPPEVRESLEPDHGRKWGKEILSDQARSLPPAARRTTPRRRFRLLLRG